MNRSIVFLSPDRRLARNMSAVQIIMEAIDVHKRIGSPRYRHIHRSVKLEAQTRGITYSTIFKNAPRKNK